MNAIQEAIAPVGQPFVTTAPTVSAVSRLHGSVGTTGREPSMEFQMRNKTFISSMVLSVACVSAANAGVSSPPGFVSINNFQDVATSGGSQYNTDPTYIPNATLFGAGNSAGLFSQGAWGTNATGNGFMTMSYGGSSGANKSWQNNPLGGSLYGPETGGPQGMQPAQTVQNKFYNEYEPGAIGAMDWSSGTAFSFDITGYSIAGGVGTYNTPVLQLIAIDVQGVYFSKTLTLVDGHVDLLFSDFTGVDFSDLYSVGFQFSNTYTTTIPAPGVGNNIVVPTGTVSISNFGYVPAPGAIALLGASGLIGARRRRA